MRTLGLFLLILSPAAGQPRPIVPPDQGTVVNPPMLGQKIEYPKAWPPGPNGRTLPEWVRDMSDKDPAVRETAIKVLPVFGPEAVPIVTRPLIARANDEDPGVRVNAIITLGAIGARTRDEAKPIVDALKLAISNAGIGSVVRLHATKALASYGILANDAIGTLIGISKDTSWETRRAVAMALGRIGQVPTPGAPKPKGTDPKPKEADMDKWSPSEKVLSTLKGMMTDDGSAAVRMEAVQSLVLLGPPDVVPPETYAEKVTPLYKTVEARLKNEKDKTVVVWLYMLQMRLNGADLNEDTIKKVTAFLDDPLPAVRVHALTALGLMGDKARPALAGIARALDSSDGYVVAAAITSLAALGETAKPVLPDLMKLTQSKDEVLKALATEAIAIINGPKKK
jgi:HEAT repeat protein